MAWTAPRTWVAGEIVTAAIMNTHVRDNLLETLQRDGSIVLTAAWDAGSYQIRAETFQSDIATGTAPLTVASTTVVTNLNADQVDGQSRALTINADHTHQATGANGGQLDHGLALTGLTDDDHTQYQKENLLTTAGDVPYATGASTWARLPIGTTLQTLRTNAGATAPEWAALTAVTFAKKIINYNDSSPVTIVTLPAGSLVIDCAVKITTGFLSGGSGADLIVGDAGDTDGFWLTMAAVIDTPAWYHRNALADRGAYFITTTSVSVKFYTASTAVIATINAQMTQGVAEVYIVYVTLS